MVEQNIICRSSSVSPIGSGSCRSAPPSDVLARSLRSGLRALDGGPPLRVTPCLNLPAHSKMVHCVLKASADFFAGVENIVRIKYFFRIFE